MYGYTEQEPRLKISTAERYLTNPYKIRFCELAQDIMSKVPPRNADTPGSSGPDFQYRRRVPRRLCRSIRARALDIYRRFGRVFMTDFGCRVR